MSSHSQDSITERVCKLVSDDSAPADTKADDAWEEIRREFLVEFLPIVNQMIARKLPRHLRQRTTWEELSATSEFQEAFELVADRVLSAESFISKMKRYVATATHYSVQNYMTTAVALALLEWQSSRKDRVTRTTYTDDSLESHTAEQNPPPDLDDGTIPFPLLSAAIDLLPPTRQAVVLLWLWPLQVLPEAWREKYLPVILDVANTERQDDEETRRRLSELMDKYGAVSEDSLAKIESRQTRSFLNQQFFYERKIRFATRLAESLNEFSPPDWDDTFLKSDCYQAVRQSCEEDVKQLVNSEQIFKTGASGLRRIKELQLWLKRRFLTCCFREKVHRRIWLNASRKLGTLRDADRPMASRDIAYILNRKVGTCDSDLSRARTTLKGQLFNENENSPNSFDYATELQDERLQQHVCENLQRPAG